MATILYLGTDDGVVTLLTAWRVPGIPKFRWDETDKHVAEKKMAESERAAS